VRFFRDCKTRFAKFQGEFQASVYGDAPIKVLCGPFEGTNYFNKIVWGPVTPKWIGSFEEELHDVVRAIIANHYDTIVDIGAAEGYYAIGLARTCPTARVITYDIDFIARSRQRSLATINALSTRINVRGRCDHAALDVDLANGKCVVISDIEGAEVELLNPAQANNLRRADVLVECHQTEKLSVDEVGQLMSTRFADSHFIEEIHSRQRSTNEWSVRHSALRHLDAKTLAYAMDEFRYAQKWLWMRAK
jgi:hypothetical protein